MPIKSKKIGYKKRRGGRFSTKKSKKGGVFGMQNLGLPRFMPGSQQGPVDPQQGPVDIIISNPPGVINPPQIVADLLKYNEDNVKENMPPGVFMPGVKLAQKVLGNVPLTPQDQELLQRFVTSPHAVSYSGADPIEVINTIKALNDYLTLVKLRIR